MYKRNKRRRQQRRRRGRIRNASAHAGLQPTEQDEDRVETGVHRPRLAPDAGVSCSVGAAWMQGLRCLLQLVEEEAVQGREPLEELYAWEQEDCRSG